ncbi:nuclear transport factor 2 family protein [Winogradskyella ouciana]|uniref:DUF4440 domain-containing protein n=1 Tax=Winogradskyella ouciana TaxID=2608631 RepID=A0A7K1GHE8_9FLAO|nr:nuclear transport factor 2 family protein [Winogradskyella ouciana]MTE27878.1 DUF4440 domain-containing protein [Winogradskyella ouciana]
MKPLKTIIVMLLLLSISTYNCNAQDVKADVEKMHQLYIEMINNSNLENIDKLYTANASIRNSDATMINGLENIKNQYKATFDSGTFTISLETTDVSQLDDNHMFVSGTFVYSKTDEPKGVLKGEFVNTLKNVNGDWKILKSYRYLETTDNASIINSVYELFSKGDIPAVLALMDDEIVWNEAESNSLADGNPYIGPDAVLNGVFARIGERYKSFTLKDVKLHEMSNNQVLATLHYVLEMKNGKTYTIQAAHHWTLKDGKIVGFQQYADTKKLADSEKI